MKIETKFRFWDETLNKMFYRHPQTYDFCTDGIVPLQYTGLKDYKKKEIFVGDILEYNIYCYGKIMEQYIYCVDIGIPDYHLVWHIENILRHYPMFTIRIIKGNPRIRIIPSNYTIIGNIYENPELLKDE